MEPVNKVKGQQELFNFGELTRPAPALLTPHDELFQRTVRRELSFLGNEPRFPSDISIEREWKSDGITGSEISYSSSWGPKIRTYVLRPANHEGELPAILALHCHGNLKRWGKEKIADDDTPACEEIRAYRQKGYGGFALGNRLAREGFVVMVPDTFMWGSRAVSPVSFEAYPEYHREAGLLLSNHPRFAGKFPGSAAAVDLTAEMARDNYFEAELQKKFEVLGTSVAAAVCNDDRISLRVLESLPGICRDRIGAVGLSGGGNRVGLLRAAGEQLKASVIVGMMSTYDALLKAGDVWKHTWMLFPGIKYQGTPVEWPDLVGIGAPGRLLCLLNRQDPLFTFRGQVEASERLKQIYSHVGAADNFASRVFEGPHKFDGEMQDAAITWLKSAI